MYFPWFLVFCILHIITQLSILLNLKYTNLCLQNLRWNHLKMSAVYFLKIKAWSLYNSSAFKKSTQLSLFLQQPHNSFTDTYSKISNFSAVDVINKNTINLKTKFDTDNIPSDTIGCLISTTTWKVSKYGVISGPYFPAFGLNADQK